MYDDKSNVMMSMKDVANWLGKSRTTVYRWTRKNILPPPCRGPKGEFLGWPAGLLKAWIAEMTDRK